MEAMAHGQFHDVPTMLRGGLRMHDPQDGPRYENPTFRPEKGQSPSFHMSRMVGILSDYCFSIWTCSEFHGTSIVSWIFALKKDIKKKITEMLQKFPDVVPSMRPGPSPSPAWKYRALARHPRPRRVRWTPRRWTWKKFTGSVLEISSQPPN